MPEGGGGGVGEKGERGVVRIERAKGRRTTGGAGGEVMER